MTGNGLTITVLSCGRFDLLRLMVESTFRVMSHPVDEVLVTEDSGLPDAWRRLDEIFQQLSVPVRYFVHDTRRGIASSMDEMYSSVKTPYVLQLEDDWVCTAVQADFVERSIQILANAPKILQVWLRPPQDCNGHPLEDGIYQVGTARYHVLTTSFYGIWHGYSNSPNVRRTQDYLLLPGGYASCEGKNSELTEAHIGEFYFRKGFVAAVLCEPDAGFVHTGVSRSVDGHPWRSPINLNRRFDTLRCRAIEMRKELEILRKAGKLDGMDKSDPERGGTFPTGARLARTRLGRLAEGSGVNLRRSLVRFGKLALGLRGQNQ